MRTTKMSLSNRALPNRSWTVAGFALALAGIAMAQQTEILIRNGTIVNSTGRTQGDLRIRNGTIAETNEFRVGFWNRNPQKRYFRSMTTSAL